jgi:hypothetical protein
LFLLHVQNFSFDVIFSLLARADDPFNGERNRSQDDE